MKTIVPDVSSAAPKKSWLQKAVDALDRAKVKHSGARNWPRFLRLLRRNQEGVDEGLITAVEKLTKEVERLSRVADQFAKVQAARNPLPAECIDRFYVDFEELFRGSQELVRERLSDYLPDLKKLLERIPNAKGVDVGCGRGEWLRLLKETGIEGHGVDQNGLMVETCRQAGLDVTQGDAMEYLRRLPDGALALVSGFHIVEHLEFPLLLALLRETFRVLAPGGMAIFETPNAECQQVSSYYFYMDPTHRNPIPMEVLSFIGKHAGFPQVELRRMHLLAENGGPEAYWDYAAIFTK